MTEKHAWMGLWTSIGLLLWTLLFMAFCGCGFPPTAPSRESEPVRRPKVEALVGPGTLCPVPIEACWNFYVHGPYRSVTPVPLGEAK